MCPSRAPHPCGQPGCSELVTNGARCPQHTKEAWDERNARPEIREDKRFYDSALWRKLRLHVLKHEPYCRECASRGEVGLAVVVDHIRPLRSGGSRTSLSNLQPLCQKDHNAKRSKESRGE